MQLMMKPVDQIKPNPTNARTHSKKQIHQISESIRAFGFRNPILIDETSTVIAGNGRLAAATLLKMSEVPVIEITGLSSHQMRALALADNRIALNAGWDLEILASELTHISSLELDFDVEVTGFETAEIDLLLDPHDAERVNGIDKSLMISARNVTQPGDLWILDDHKLLCGDSVDPSVVAKVMDGDKARMGFADPPYNVPIDGHVCGSGSIKHREFPMAVGEMSEAEFIGFLTSVFRNMGPVSLDGAIHFICMDWRHMAEVLSAGRTVYSELKNLCVWNKDNGGMGSFYRSKQELVFVFKWGKAPHINTIKLGRHGRYRTNVWDYPGVNTRDLKLHPTVKPLALVIDAIKDCSRRNEIVLDPFAGSGTTIIAAEKSGRRARGIEIDPLYVDLAIRRWQLLTGKTAHLAANERTFDEVAATLNQTTTGAEGLISVRGAA